MEKKQIQCVKKEKELFHSLNQTNRAFTPSENNMVHLDNNYILNAYFWNCQKIFVCPSYINGLSSQAALFRISSEERRWVVVKCIHVA